MSGEVVAPEADILETVRAIEAKNANGSDDEDEGDPSGRDELFREAAELVIRHKGGSTSLLQRHLRVGYGRAARIVDQLEEAGILAASKGPSRPRDVLVGSAELDRICATS